ncbi:sigma factor-like helix-turn-helix DNA-binding protein [Actinosynnema sp. ALI-1.44]|uniref:sigma factor-like helix-turn-helix DNA-binding protein n=1 Tax=Actinosynnema sp. ALI-1.44 TaxID=1933779 RepID=UPI0022A981F8|nr:sigma factor-like helix-turn-helix DNA-binding protein [Actinosynnema sp. ALI-1.44]
MSEQNGLGALPPLQRKSIELAYYGGLTYTEIGDVHHIPAGTARSLLRDALIGLRDRV